MRSRSYAWARHLEATDVTLAELSDTAQLGYEAALRLAEDAYERSRDPRPSWLEPLALDEVAADYDLPAATLSRYIALARRQLFGNLTLAAIYKRLQRQTGRKPRSCSEKNCSVRIPITAPANKHYCDAHSTNAARVRRHRKTQTANP